MKTYDVDPEKLAQVFDNTTSTYKFYWLLSLLEQIKEGKAYQTISFTEMVATMISKAWNPITSGQFTFGKCDSLIQRTRLLIFGSELKVYDVEDRVRKYIIENPNLPLIKDIVDKMTKYVPYRFLYPWIGTMSNSESSAASRDFETYRCPYCIEKKTIRLNPVWIQYLTDNLPFIESYAKMGLQYYLLSYNDNIMLADNDVVATTSDGYSISTASQMGLACEGSTSYAKSEDVQSELRKTRRELNEMRNNFRKILALVQPSSIINNFGPSTQIDNHDGGNITTSPKA